MSTPIKTQLGVNPDGTIHYNYSFANPDGTPIDGFLGATLLTGPITGAVTLSDGSVYDVTEFAVDCKPEHVGPLNHHIHKALYSTGTVPTAHVCSDDCGFEQGK